MKKNKPKVGNDLKKKNSSPWGVYGSIARYENGYRCSKCDAKVSTVYNGECEDCTDYFD